MRPQGRTAALEYMGTGHAQTVGEYNVIRLIGNGGMGAVYEVEHRALGVRYALKTFALDHGEVDFLRERFIAEARTLARLSHPNLARVFDLGVMDDGTAYFVMDLVLDPEGEVRTLDDVSPDAFDDSDRWRWFVSLASALDSIHAEGIVHRDVKLGNILVNRQRNAVLVDFGISRYVKGRIKREIGVASTVVAPDGEAAKKLMMGTGGYLAPELLRGEEASAASDSYALGVAFFRLLTGIWYEPGTDALRLLEPLEGSWREVLPPMLDADPAKRPVKLSEFLHKVRTGVVRPRGTKVARRAFLAASLVAVAAAATWLYCRARPDPARHGNTLTFDLGEGVGIEMVECRPANAAPFWIGASHVTNAEWHRLTGDERKGGGDVPVVGMSLSEVRGLLDELNRRFAARVPKGFRFRLPTAAELVVASTADGANAADASVLGVLGPSVADKKTLAAQGGIKWESGMTKRPCRVRTKPPNAWGVYDIVGQGRTICRETEISPKDGKTRHLQLGPDDVAERSTVGEWGWNSTIRIALGKD